MALGSVFGRRAGGSTKEAERFESDSKESYRRFLKTQLLAAIVKIIAYSCATVSLGIAFVFITDDVITGVLTPGDYTVLFAMFWMMGEKARLLGTYWIDLQKNVAAVRRVFFFIDYTSEADRTTTLLSAVRRGVSLDAVSFAYPDGRAALSDINLELSLGELVAIVGPTGAGKTTLAYLLPGFLQPSAGTVCLDDMDICGACNEPEIPLTATKEVCLREGRVAMALGGWRKFAIVAAVALIGAAAICRRRG